MNGKDVCSKLFVSRGEATRSGINVPALSPALCRADDAADFDEANGGDLYDGERVDTYF